MVMRVVVGTVRGDKEERMVSVIMDGNAKRDRREKVRGINCAIKKRGDK